jgi:hypothetical protein
VGASLVGAEKNNNMAAVYSCRSIKRGKDEIPDFFPQINGQKEVTFKILILFSNTL